MEKISAFSDGKYDVHVPAAQITEEYENKRTDAWEVIENLNITKRIVSTAKMMQNSRANSSSTTSSGFGARSPPPMGRSVSGGSFVKKAPPPPPSLGSTAPPPYSASAAGSAAASAAAAKRAPPPPPPLKPKPKVEPPVQYVVALYDFAPQVCIESNPPVILLLTYVQAEGDLEFSAGDRIEVVKRTESTEDWWTGRLDGREGVFPGAPFDY